MGPGIAKAIIAPHLNPPACPRLVVAMGKPRRALVEERLETLVAGVDWGDGTDYGEDVVAPPIERRDEALAFLKGLARSATNLNLDLPLPEVSPTVDGDVDIHWRGNGGRELLLCVSENGQASFFGKSTDGQTIKGAVRTDDDSGFIAAWLGSAR